ncbi:MAG: 16S rRNA (uracil(1498)-N(3))-methyltransferase [Alphaproteobacteria bacterium]|nr:16S rRNA (uracil(1498)-N(3))-methyltransferase [Alphaproteobacteria bacterium]
MTDTRTALSPAPRPPRVRLYVESALAPGARVALSAEQTHYLGRVMRLGPDDGVLLFNGRDGEWRGRIAALGRKAGETIAEQSLRPQPAATDIWQLFAPLKKTATDFLVEKATELGASRLVPVFTRRTVSERVNAGRLRARAIEAAEQCERLDVPEIAESRALEEAVRSWPGNRRLFVGDEQGGGRPVADVFASGFRGPIAFLTGPEGGFDPSELDALGRLPFVSRVALGPRILRAETAALALLACWQALAGDGREPPAPWN